MGCNPGEAMYDKKGNGSKLLPSPKFYLEVIHQTIRLLSDEEVFSNMG